MLNVIALVSIFLVPTISQHLQVKRQEDGLELFLRNSFYNFGEFLATGAYDLRTPSMDPVEVKRKFTFKTSTNSTRLDTTAKQMTISGLSNMSITDIDMNVPNLTLHLTLTIPKLMITGQYSAKGLIYHVFPLQGNGDFVIECEDVLASADVQMKMNEENNNLDVDKFGIGFKAKFLMQAFENVLGGGHIGSLINHFARKLGKSIFETLHPFLARSFGEAVRRKLVQVLRKIRISPETGSAANVKRAMQGLDEAGLRSEEKFNDYFDHVLDNFKKMLKQRDLDPLPLPDFGSTIFQNGSASGLLSLQRLSDAIISLSGNKLMVDFTFLLQNTSWTWFLTEFGHDGKVELRVNSVTVSLGIEVDLLSRDIAIEVAKFRIIDMKGILFDLDMGLGLFDSLLLSMVNDVADGLTSTFIYLLEEVFKWILEFSVNDFLKTNQ